MTLARCGSGRRPSEGRSGGDGGPIEKEIGQPPPPQPVLFNTARSDGPKNSEMELEVEKEVRQFARLRGGAASRVGWVAAEDRVRCEGSVRETPPPVPVTARFDEYKTSKRRPEEEKGDGYQEGSTEALPLGWRVGGYGSASNARRRALDAGSAAASVPKALTRADGEHSDRESQTSVQIRSAQPLPCKGEPEDRGRRRHRVLGPPRRRS